MAIYAYYTGTGLRNSTESEKNSQQLLLKYCIYRSLHKSRPQNTPHYLIHNEYETQKMNATTTTSGTSTSTNDNMTTDNDGTTILQNTCNTTSNNNTVACTISTLTTTTQRKKSKSSLFSKAEEKKVRIGMLDDAVKIYHNALKIVSETGKRVSKHTFQNIAKVFGNPTWMDRHTIRNHHIKWKKKNNNNNNPPEVITVDNNNNNNNNNEGNISELTNDSSKKVRNKGGRPTGTISSADVEKYEKLIRTATAIAAKKYQQLKASNKKKKLQNGMLDTIIKESLAAVGLPQEHHKAIKKGTIKSRVIQNNPIGMKGSFSQCSPMAAIEPMLAEFCRHLNRMAKSITQQEFLDLANDIIVDTPTSDKVKEFQLRICGLEVEDGQQQRLGTKYFYNFMARHDDILHTTKIKKNV
jgi:hypothetical protein